ncbi:uncharacterized protein LOC123506974 isoform X2 [Portunus trituberculatus]|uniref:uncharacterized protein LOC123506974 isoform X2 n=1 Tax=Portunus trituberculatus TaxID=210409 RepID=UPI001E1D20A3|nr:uncharacterized protein LOC123506974 isoform X2 [Portunus trituberculatus]
MSGTECGAPLVMALVITLLPHLSLAMEAHFATLSSRLAKVDSLVEKVEALDSRLTQETSSLRSTINATNTDLQELSTRLDRMTTTSEMRLRGGEEEEEEERNTSQPLTRSRELTSSNTHLPSSLITRYVAEEVQRTLPVLLDRSLATFHDSLYKRLSESVGRLQDEVREAREDLEHLGTQTLSTATSARQDIRQGGKATQDAVTDIKNRIQSVHRDLALQITSSPSLSSLEPVLRQVNLSVVESIARAAAGLNVTLLGEASRRRGVSEGEERGDRPVPPMHCPDPTTVAALLEIKLLLQSLLRKSEDLRRGLTKKTSEGVELLKFLHQRFAVLVRRMNTDPDYGQVLVDEMQSLGNLVESSYTAVMMAQTAFIDSCKRIQEEEPLLERKMTLLLDKLVTNIDLGYRHNRQQLSELKDVVTKMGQLGTAPNVTQEPATTRTKAEGQTLGDAAAVPGEMQNAILQAVDVTNHTVARLEEVEGYVDTVAADLLNTEWRDSRQKDSADQLVTAAKDLKGHAQEQILQSLDFYEILLMVLEQFNANSSVKASQDQPVASTTMPPLELLSDAAPLTLPSTCTVALLEQITSMKMRQTSALANSDDTPLAGADPGQQGQEERQKDVLEEEEVEDKGDDEEEEEDVPAWYTDPVFLSGNYGTPDRGLPVFREEDWVDMDDAYDNESTPPPPPTTTPATTSPRPGTTGLVSRYFGVP